MATNEKPPNREERRLAQFGPAHVPEEPITTPPNKSQANFEKLRLSVTLAIERLQTVQDWMARVSKISHRRLAQIEVVGLLGLGALMIQLTEWAAAIACWILVSILLFIKGLAWEGWAENPKRTSATRLSWLVGSIVVGVVLTIWTDFKKPDDQPWTAFQKWSIFKRNDNQAIPPPTPVLNIPTNEQPLSLADSTIRAIENRTFSLWPKGDPKRTSVMIQLEPATYEDDGKRRSVNAIGVQFSNLSEKKDADVSIEISLFPLSGIGPKPIIKKIECDNANRVQILSGGFGTTVAQIMTAELIPQESHLCTVSLTQDVDGVNTVTQWKRLFGTPKARSVNFGQFDTRIYRVHVGSKEKPLPGSWGEYVRPTTFEVK